LGHSYRAGGEIFLIAAGVAVAEDGIPVGPCKIAKADFRAFLGTGYDGRGCHYSVWIFSPGGEMVLCSAAEHAQADEGKRMTFGSESRSCSNSLWYCDQSEKTAKGLADFGAAFAALGLDTDSLPGFPAKRTK
jgi:hypothetical protein